MTRPMKPTDLQAATEKLREARLADEATRKAAGTYGDLSVGEVTHRESRSVYVQVWKGVPRPAIAGAIDARHAGVPAAEWPAVAAWLETLGAGDLHRSVVAWRVSKTEAQRLKSKRVEENRAAGLTVVNEGAPSGG